MDAIAQPRITLTDALPDAAAEFWDAANKQILWGWKRDVATQNRMVYFSGDMVRTGRCVDLARFYFHYAAKIKRPGSDALIADLQAAHSTFRQIGIAADFGTRTDGAYVRVALALGLPTEQDIDRARRLKLRRPRRHIPVPDLPEPVTDLDPATFLPADLYVGSGISYEAGLPTLCDMHDIFGVDCHAQRGFTVGAEDWLPRALADEDVSRIRLFCTVHTMALDAEATDAMRHIRQLMDARHVGRIFTDNVDNVLAKAEVPFERVRGSGVFNERYPAEFASPNLIVVGVAADRRQIIRQARGAGIRVIIVNPCKKVSPNVTHLDYVRNTDIFYKETAQDFFARFEPGAR
jgi:hypothetical protein